MENQEMPAGSENKYVYLPAKQDDQVAKTGRPKYLPIDKCQSYGIGCNSKVKYKVLATRPTEEKSQVSSRLVRNYLMVHKEGSWFG